MNQPSSHARLILERYKAAEAPRAAERVRLGDVIRERAMRGDLPRFDVHATSLAIPRGGLAGHAWGSVAGKASLVLLVLGAGAGVSHQLRNDSRQTELEAAMPVAVQAHDAADPSPSTEPAPARKAQSATKEEEVINPLQNPAPARPGRPLASPSEPTIDDEVKLVKAAEEALRAGDTKRAFQLLDEDAARFPVGKLASVRQLVHMTALCQAGQAERARHEATSFLAKNPSSPFSERVKTICR